jgi:hypothetical protein
MKRKALRRTVGVTLIVAGGLLMWLSPETLSGALVMGAGVALELLGMAFEHS